MSEYEHCDLLILMLLLTAPIIWFSLNHNTAELKKWKIFDSCDSGSLKLMTQAYDTTNIDIHKVISALVTPVIITTWV